jgi:hypothetical protein
MANKHQTAPTAIETPGKFHETCKDWLRKFCDKITLDLFPGDFRNDLSA